jgi:hypothetical protein
MGNLQRRSSWERQFFADVDSRFRQHPEFVSEEGAALKAKSDKFVCVKALIFPSGHAFHHILL